MTAAVLDQLSLLAGAPGGIAQLRRLILDLAVTGKLVLQEAADGSAEALVAQIAAVKAALGQKGKDRGKALPPSDPSGYELPTGWVHVRLDDLTTKLGAGSTPLGGKQVYTPDGVMFLRSQNVWNNGLRLDDVARIPSSIHNGMAGTHVVGGDLLFNITGASIGRCAMVPSNFEGGNVSQHVVIVRPALSELQPYLHKVLVSDLVQDAVTAEQVGVSREGLSVAKLAAFKIPLPPLAEQRRIVARVDELMALCDRLEALQQSAEAAHARLVQALLDSLIQAPAAGESLAVWQRLAEQFKSLFTTEASIDALEASILQLAVTGRLTGQTTPLAPPVDDEPGLPPLAAGWMYRPFNELIDPERPIAYGVLVPGAEVDGGVPFVRIADLSIQSPVHLPEKTIAHDVDAKFRRTRLVGGEILMGVVGSVGKLGVAPASWAGANIARAICRIVPAPGVNKDYVLLLLRSGLMRRQFLGDTRTLAQPTLNVGLIRAAKAPVPPPAEQERVVRVAHAMLAFCDQLKPRIANARAKQSQLAETLVEAALA
jgi:type I restriction enzyme, S subunit